MMSICKLTAKMLNQKGIAVLGTFQNGSTALKAMIERDVDCVFSDIQMPIMTGPEMISRFRSFEKEELKSGRRVKRQIVIAVIANGNEQNGARVGPDPFDHILFKPLNVNELDVK
jgi:CheY-like chemotaxis protein